MIEIKGLSKTYNTKGGSVRALRNVTLKFEDRGMVFILGKSGSGKSTLLNLIGGLDRADGGEIYIDSEKISKPSDFDRYRRECIGFVFQEYNLLEELSVEKNISLAMRMHGDKADKERGKEILKEVEMEGYGRRKPRELSGGQRQRVAIARAMIKDPRILLADEPTGALDSDTGKTVLESLRILSRDRLVIVVSHDREFAETYADRIIELADGEVISDKELKGEERETRTENIKNREKGKSGRNLLASSEGAAIVRATMSRKRIRLIVTIMLCAISFVMFGLIDVALGYDRYYTAQEAMLKNKEGIAFKASIKKYDNNIKYDLSWSSYGDLEKLRNISGLDFQGVIGGGSQGLPLWKAELLNDGSKNEYYRGRYGNILPATEELFESQDFKLFGRIPENEREIVITKYIYDQFAKAGIEFADGSYIPPEEIGDIESFLAKEPYMGGARHNIVANVEWKASKIVGIVDTRADKYGKFKDANKNYRFHYFEDGYHSLLFVYPTYYDRCLDACNRPNNTGFGKEVTARIGNVKSGMIIGGGVATDKALEYTDSIIWLDGKGDRERLAENEIVLGVGRYRDLWPVGDAEHRGFCNYSKRHIGDTVSFKYMNLADFRIYGASWVAFCEEAEKISEQELEIYKQYCRENDYVFDRFNGNNSEYYVYGENYKPESMSENNWRFSYACYLSYGEVPNNKIEGGRYNNVTGRACGFDISDANHDRIFIENRVENALYSRTRIDPNDYKVVYSGVSRTVQFGGAPEVVGIYFPKEGYPDDYFINNVLYENSEYFEESVFEFFIAPMPKDRETVRRLIDLHYDDEDVRGFKSLNLEFNAADSIGNPLEILTPYFKAFGIILGAFSVLLLGNYIAISISARKRDIGILRSMGASKGEVYAIFVAECVIVTAIILVLAIIGLAIACVIFCSHTTYYGIEMKVLHVKWRHIAIICALGIGTTLVASIIPMWRLSRKRPIDCIQGR